MKITKAEMQTLLAEANARADSLNLQLEKIFGNLAVAETKAKLAMAKLAKMRAAAKVDRAKFSSPFASVAVDSEGRLAIVMRDNAAASGAYPITSTPARIVFNAEDSTNIVMALAEPHFETLSAFFVADLNELRARLCIQDTEYAAETDALRRELRKVKRLISMVSGMLSRSAAAKVSM